MPTSHNHRLLAGVLLLATASAGGGQLAPDHPIYSVPRFLTTMRIPHGLPPASALPIWSGSLPKKQYLAGETIWATVTVRNPGSGYSLGFSPPRRGLMVSTVGVWQSMAGEGGGTWPTPVCLLSANKGQRPVGGERQSQFQGKPIVLEPGKGAEFVFPINVLEPVLWGGEGPVPCGLGWVPGVGFLAPGRYRVFLQYLNLEDERPFEQRALPGGGLRSTVPPGRLVVLPYRPIVIGPLDVEVSARSSPARQEVLKLMTKWEEVRLTRGMGHSMVPQIDLDRVGVLTASLGDEDAELRTSLCALRAEFCRLRSQSDPAPQAMADLLDRSRQARRALRGNPIEKAFLITECYVLWAMGRIAEAQQLARQAATPDAEVFLADLVFDTKSVAPEK